MSSKVILTNLLVFCAINSVFSQYVQEVISPNGGYTSSQGVNISWTLGETAIASYVVTDLNLEEGFEQPIVYLITGQSTDLETIFYPYPNPFHDSFSIKLAPTPSQVLVTIFNLNGVVRYKSKVNAVEYLTINSAEWSAGTYILKIQFDNSTATHHRIQKY